MPGVGKKPIGVRMKKKATPKIKVSQSTIDKIKARGMTASLKKAQTSTNAEYQEAIKRMYGTRRATAAKGQGADARIAKPSLAQPKKPRGGGGRQMYR
jgi:hypothetical protein